MVPPAFAAYFGLYNALTGDPGSLTIKSLQEQLTIAVDGVDFIAGSAASHHPAALCLVQRLLGSMQIFKRCGWIIPDLLRESTLPRLNKQLDGIKFDIFSTFLIQSGGR